MTTIRHLPETIGNGSGPHGRVWTAGLAGPERDLIDSAASGTLLNLPQGARPPDEAATPKVKGMKIWGAGRTIRAEMLRHLLVESEWPVHTKGVQLQGARITGELDLQSATLRCPLVLANCYLEKPVLLDCVTSSRLAMRHCLLGGVRADLLTVTRDLDLSGSTVTDTVRLLGAQISGQLLCRGTKIEGTDDLGSSLTADEASVGRAVFLDKGFTTAGAVRLARADIKGLLLCRDDVHIKGRGKDGYALFADEVMVRASALFDEGFTADGPLRLVGASFTGQLNFRGARINGADSEGQSVFADGITVGAVFLDKHFRAEGAVRLFGATITGDLKCSGARIGGNKAGYALVAERATVTRSVSLDEGFTAGGAVRLAGATVKGDLRCTGAWITGNKDNNALEADRITVGGDASLNDGFTVAGALRLSGAQIDGRLSLGGATLEGPVGQDEGAVQVDDAELKGQVALMAEGAKIGQELVWAPTSAVKGIVSLERTRLHRLDDDWGDGEGERNGAYWPGEGNLRLSGFVYDGFGGEHQATCRQRLGWIRGQHQSPARGRGRTFDPQPYQQLARVYRQAGAEDDAIEIAVHQRSDLRTYGSLSVWQKVVNLLLDRTISHGYRPRRAVRILVAVWFVAFVMFSVAQQQKDLMVPVTGSATASRCTKAYPCFVPAGYAIDITIPIIQTGQAASWRPNDAAHLGWLYLGSTWVFTGLGWAFTSLAVAGYTGLIRRD